MSAPPPQHVLESFGLTGATTCLVEGGQRTTFRVGDFALKPCDTADESEWLGPVLSTMKEDGFRVARPKVSSDGRFVVSGWCAFHWVAGDPQVRGRWREAMSACRAFHVALSDVPRPRLLDERSDPYSLCDRIAWGEESRDVVGDLGAEGERLFERLRPLALPAQLIHSDLSEGNLLFQDGQSPAVIDLVLRWRPADYALAILLADGVAWSQAPVSLLEEVRDVPGIDGLLARAVLFRLCVGKLLRGGEDEAKRRSAAYLPVIRRSCR